MTILPSYTGTGAYIALQYRALCSGAGSGLTDRLVDASRWMPAVDASRWMPAGGCQQVDASRGGCQQVDASRETSVLAQACWGYRSQMITVPTHGDNTVHCRAQCTEHM